VDEIHAMAANKRGVHLSLSLGNDWRPCAAMGCCASDSRRRRNPIALVKKLLVGHRRRSGGPKPRSSIPGIRRKTRSQAIEVPGSPLEAVMSHEVWVAGLWTSSSAWSRPIARPSSSSTHAAHGPSASPAHFPRRPGLRRAVTRASRQHGQGAIASPPSRKLKHGPAPRAGRDRAIAGGSASISAMSIWSVSWARRVRSPLSCSGSGAPGHAVRRFGPRARLFSAPSARRAGGMRAALLDSVRRGELDRLSIPEQPMDVPGAAGSSPEVRGTGLGRDKRSTIAFPAVPIPYRDLTRRTRFHRRL